MCDEQNETTGLNILKEARALCPQMVSRTGRPEGLQALRGQDPTAVTVCLSFISALEGAILGSNSSCLRVTETLGLSPHSRGEQCAVVSRQCWAQSPVTQTCSHTVLLCMPAASTTLGVSWGTCYSLLLLTRLPQLQPATLTGDGDTRG